MTDSDQPPHSGDRPVWTVKFPFGDNDTLLVAFPASEEWNELESLYDVRPLDIHAYPDDGTEFAVTTIRDPWAIWDRYHPSLEKTGRDCLLYLLLQLEPTAP